MVGDKTVMIEDLISHFNNQPVARETVEIVVAPVVIVVVEHLYGFLSSKCIPIMGFKVKGTPLLRTTWAQGNVLIYIYRSFLGGTRQGGDFS